MADTQTQDSTPPPSPAIADLAGADDKSMAGLVSSLTDLQRKKVATDTRLSNQSDEQQDRDRAVRNHAFQMEGVAASEMPKAWDADKEHKKWETNPIEGFGSAGGLFAMVASAFTKAPMENAINGMAGAINSIKEGNEAGYARAYDAFKTNVKLADQRFKTQHELYSDALSLGHADAAASAAKFNNAAVRFGDSQMLMLAEHGMIKEIYELQASRASANEQMIKAADAIDLHTVQKAAVDAIKKNPPQTGDPVQDKMQLAAQIQRVYDGGGKYGTAEQEAVGKYVQAHINEDAIKFAEGLSQIHQQFSVKAPNIQGYQEARQAAMEANGGVISPDEDAKLLQQFGLTQRPTGSGAGGTTTNKIEAEEIKRRADSYVKDGMEPGAAFDKAMKEVKTAERKPDQLKPPTENNVVAAEISKRAADYVANGMDPHEAFDKALKEIKAAETKPVGSAATALTNDRVINKDAEEHKKATKAEHPDWDEKKLDADRDAYVKQRKLATAAPSGNRADDLQSKIDQTDNILRESQANLDFLHQFKGGAGLMGKIMRGEEIASNIVGAGTQSERVAFRRRVHELQEMVPRIITDSNGRPLKAAQDKVDDFVAGLNAGDTSANTIRAYEDLIAEMKKRQGDYVKRKTGATETPVETAAPVSADWLSAYPEKK